MFGSLSQKLSKVFSALVGARRVTEENLSEALREVRLALLEADVSYISVKAIVSRVKERIIGRQLSSGEDPGMYFISCVREEICKTMAGTCNDLSLTGNPAVVLLFGLQGVGKTTTAAKLGLYLRKKGKRVLLVSCDLKRPAAVEQLRIIGKGAGLEVFDSSGRKDVLQVVSDALGRAKSARDDVVIVDTAGRSSVDDELIKELSEIKKHSGACESLFVMNPAFGQDAVSVAKVFNDQVGLTGVILSMMDGDAKGGSILSIKDILDKPIKFEGYGERPQDFRSFDAESVVDRMIGAGDVRGFMKELRGVVSEEEEKEFEKKVIEASFTYEDYYNQMKVFRRMGPLRKVVRMFGGLGGGPSEEQIAESEKEFTKTESMILSMTPEERKERVTLDMSRMKRIAAGAGVTIGDINQFRKKMSQSKKFFKGMTRDKMERITKKMSGGNKWR